MSRDKRPSRRNFLIGSAFGGLTVATSSLLPGCSLLAPESEGRQAILAYLAGLRREDGGFGWRDQPDSHLTPAFSCLGVYHLLGSPVPNPEAAAQFVRTHHPLRGEWAETRISFDLRNFLFEQIQALLWLNQDVSEFQEEVLGWKNPPSYPARFERHGDPLLLLATMTFSCRRLLGLSLSDLPPEFITYLRSRRRSNGSFNNSSAEDGSDGNILNTLACLEAFRDLGLLDELRNETIEWLQSCQREDGGFSHQPNPQVGGISDVTYTRAALLSLGLLGAAPVRREECAAQIISLWNSDGGFGARPGLPSSPVETYRAVESLLRLGLDRPFSKRGGQQPQPSRIRPLPDDLRPYTIQIEAHGKGSPSEAVELAKVLGIDLWGAKNAVEGWIDRAQGIADERGVPVKFFVADEEYGTYVEIPGAGTFSHVADIVAPAGKPFGKRVSGDEDNPWLDFLKGRVKELEAADGRLVWQICHNEPFSRILLDDSLERGTGYAAISTYHFWCSNMVYAQPFMFRYRDLIPFVALQDAHENESWWWSDNLAGFRTVFLGRGPTWQDWLTALKNNWVVSVRHDEMTHFRTRILGGAEGVQERVRELEGDWKWWRDDPGDLGRPMAALTILRPGEPFEAEVPERGIRVRVRCAHKRGEGHTVAEALAELTELTLDGKEVETKLVNRFRDPETQKQRTDTFFFSDFKDLRPGNHQVQAIVCQVDSRREEVYSVNFTV